MSRAARHKDRPFYGVQFHPEVTHTPRGEQLFQNFLYEICHSSGSWTMGNFVEQTTAAIRKQVGDAKVICGLSGGVDSSVAATLVHRAIGDQLTNIFVDTGLLRAGGAQRLVVPQPCQRRAALPFCRPGGPVPNRL